MAKLFVVATPIGNLADISKRALEVLGQVDLILSEDTRVIRKLLNYFEIKTPAVSYHQHSKLNKVNYILEQLEQGKDLALVSDAGTPGISDPGNQLIEQVVEYNNKAGQNRKIEIIPIPGPSALTTAISISGLPMSRFVFLGFPPQKNKRQKFFQQVAESQYPVVLFESPHRILKTLSELPSNAQLVVCRELTKKFETIYRGAPQEVAKQIEDDRVGDAIKGEFVIIINRW